MVDVRVVVVWEGAVGIRCHEVVRIVASRSRCRPASDRSACRAHRPRPRWPSAPQITAQPAAAVS